MPSLQSWLTFAAASEALLILPGPTVLMVISYALSHGRRSAWATVPGVALGDFTAMAMSLLGLGAVLAASAELFTALKIGGALYLIYLGIRALMARVPEQIDELPANGRSNLGIATHAYVVTALNPKSIVFYVAFFPLFLEADRSILLQVAVYGGTFLVMATINAALYAFLAGTAQEFLRGHRARIWLNRCAGGLLIACGGLLGLARRGS